ncbi:hypothetical protein ACIRON_02630 [Nocardioides sp. NPDC101246]|uniref:hypothetical protein n=1 Tax=Nocardioides sp. NPDC101246 TaxID=3364336 RepID=UPI00380CFEB4
MPLPSNVGTGTVTGNFSEDAIPGVVITNWKVTLVPSARQFSDVTATPPTVTFLKPFYEGTLDADGDLSMVVPATNDPDLNPLDFTYRVTYSFPGLGMDPQSFYIEVPEGGTVNLPAVNPVQQSNGALIVEGIPSGGTTGQVLTKASGTNYDTEWADPTGGGGGGAVTSVAGKTGVVTLVKGDVGLGNVDNTSDANKPVSTATSTALGLKADKASPTFTGTPAAPTATAGTNTTQLATTAFVTAAVAAGGGGGGAVDSVNGQTGVVVLDAADVGARPDTYVPAWSDVTSKPAVIAAGADAATARSAIGAGTSNLTIGTTSTTAMAGNKTAVDLGGIVSDVTGIPGAFVLPNVVGISATDYAALTDPETTYPDVTFLVLG